MNRRIWTRMLALAPALFFLSAPAAGQCEPELVETFSSDDPTNQFGRAVAVDGDLVVVGAPADKEAGNYPGAVYVYRFDGTDWPLEQKLTVPGAQDRFLGSSVAVSGNIIVAGARGENGYEGAIYVFQRQQEAWKETAILTPPGLGVHSEFGSSVVLEIGERGPVVAGAAPDWPLGGGVGSVHVYRYDGQVWQYESKLVPADPQKNDAFGTALALDHDRLVVGASWHDNFRGAAYTFAHNIDGWTENAKLAAEDGFVNQFFGSDVDIDANTAVVGADAYDPQCDCPGPVSAYVFREDAGVWTQEAKLVPSDGMNEDFGIRVALDGDVAVVGSDEHDEPDDSAYVYVRAPGGWEQWAILRLPGVNVIRDLGMSGLQAVFGGSAVGSSPVVLYRLCDTKCYADLDSSGDLTLFDFLAFVNLFNAGNLTADCDGTGELDLFDFLCFVNAFNAGCG